MIWKARLEKTSSLCFSLLIWCVRRLKNAWKKYYYYIISVYNEKRNILGLEYSKYWFLELFTWIFLWYTYKIYYLIIFFLIISKKRKFEKISIKNFRNSQMNVIKEKHLHLTIKISNYTKKLLIEQFIHWKQFVQVVDGGIFYLAT